MGYLAPVSFVIAVVSAFLGYGGFENELSGAARILFFVSCIVFVIVLIDGKLRNENFDEAR